MGRRVPTAKSTEFLGSGVPECRSAGGSDTLVGSALAPDVWVGWCSVLQRPGILPDLGARFMQLRGCFGP